MTAIVPGRSGDLHAVMAVMAASFDPRFGEAWTEAQCASLLSMPGVWLTLAREDEGTVGFSLSRIIVDEAELLLLAVGDSAQRRGVGRSLLAAFESEAAGRGARRVHLEVREGNRALALYERAGFGLVGRRPRYYVGPRGDRYDALTFSKSLPLPA